MNTMNTMNTLNYEKMLKSQEKDFLNQSKNKKTDLLTAGRFYDLESDFEENYMLQSSY